MRRWLAASPAGLESLGSGTVAGLIAAENDRTARMIGRAGRAVRAAKARLSALHSYEKVSGFTVAGGRAYFARVRPGSGPELCRCPPCRPAAAKKLAGFRAAGRGEYFTGEFSVCPRGRRVACRLGRKGTDDQRILVVDAADGRKLEFISGVRHSSVVWRSDGSGFYYSAPSAGGHSLRFHRLGTAQAEDSEELFLGSGICNALGEDAEEGLLLAGVYGHDSLSDGPYLIKRGRPGLAALGPAAGMPGADLRFAGKEGSSWYFLADRESGSVLYSADLSGGTPGPARKVMGFGAGGRVEGVLVAGRRVIAARLRGGSSEIIVGDRRSGAARTFRLPPCTVSSMDYYPRGGKVIFSSESFTCPTGISSLNPATGAIRALWRPALAYDPGKFGTRAYAVKKTRYGEVTAFVSGAAGAAPGGAAYVYCYGGFGVPQTPVFRAANIFWMESGFRVVAAVIRGGGEFGARWHRAGIGPGKKDSVRDLLAVMGFLGTGLGISPRNALACGGSHGALMIASAMAEAPELFGACVLQMGPYDIENYARGGCGWAWREELGDPRLPAVRKNLAALSPLRRIRAGRRYPPTLITAALNDGRVPAWHSLKLQRALQAADGGGGHYLLVDPGAGHRQGFSDASRIDEAVMKLAFSAGALPALAAV